MKCPRDNSELTDKDISQLDRENGSRFCEECSGLWVPFAALKAKTKCIPKGFPGRLLSKFADQKGVCCPLDGAVMVVCRSEGIPVDICPHCHGLWCDAFEYCDLLNRLNVYDTNSILHFIILDLYSTIVGDSEASPVRARLRTEYEE